MLSSKNISKRFSVEALNTACHISNHVYLRSGLTMTSYEILIGKRPKQKYFHVLECVCYVLHDRDHLDKFVSKRDKFLFLGYSNKIRAYRMFNLRIRMTLESNNVMFDDLADFIVKMIKDDVNELLEASIPHVNNDVVSDVSTPLITPPLRMIKSEDHQLSNETLDGNDCGDIPSKIQKDQPSSQIIGDVHGNMWTRRK